MTYTVTITDPGAEPVPLQKSDYADATKKVMEVLFNLDGVNIDSFSRIMAICAEFLGKARVAQIVSLEWTTEVPTVAGLYFCGPDSLLVRIFLANDGLLRVDECECPTVDEWRRECVSWRWLGPIPLPPGWE